MRWIVGAAACLLLAVSARADDAAPAAKDAFAGLHDPSPRKRVASAWSLAERRTPQDQAAWTAVLGDPARPELHFEAAARLAAIDDLAAGAREALEAALAREDRAVRLAASVALRRTADDQLPIDSIHASWPGEATFGVRRRWRPAEGHPTTFDAASLDSTLWMQTSGINILGEGAVTYVSLLRVGDDLVARTARATRSLERTRGGAKGQAPKRRWRTDWTFATGWIDVAARRWQGARAQPRLGPMLPASADGPGVGLALGRLVVPALVRRATDRWTFAGLYQGLTFRFRETIAVGRAGSVEVTIEPRVGETITGAGRWRLDDDPDGPLLRIDDTVTVPGGRRAIRPHRFLFDPATGTGAATGSPRHTSAMYVFVARMPPPAKAK